MGLADDLQEEHGDPGDIDIEEDNPFGGPSKGPYLPPGEWLLRVDPEYTEYTDTTTGGKMIKLQLRVETESQKGRCLFPNLNVINDDPDVQSDARDKLEGICQACGLDTSSWPELAELYNQTFIGRTGLKWSDFNDDYEVTLWGVTPKSEGPARGRWSDDEMPEVWDEAVAYAKDDQDGGGGKPSGGGDPKTESWDDEDIPF